jgi:membrane protein implicated in regulation of membrane protease activity
MARWVEAARWIAFPGKRLPPVEAIWLAIFGAFLALLLFILFSINSYLGFFGFAMFGVFAATALKASLRRRRASRPRAN